MSRALGGAAEPGGWGGQRDDTGPGLSGWWGRGVTDRGTWKNDLPPKTLKSGLLSSIREMIQDQHTSPNGGRPL